MQSKQNDWLEYASVSDVGMRRKNNQDSFAIALAADSESWTRRGHVFLVADGMGAHAAGELASKIAADGIPHAYHKRPETSQPVAIRKAIEEINSQIHQRGEANAEFQGMGTTVSALVLLPQGAIAAQVGDSRVYRLRGNRLEQLTFDHSLVWEMMAAGQMGKESVPSFIPKNIITRSLGPQPHVQVDLEGPFPLEVGDTFLLCSDGLTGQLKDEELGVILASTPPSEAAAVLVDLANLRGGPDNITIIVVKVRSQPPDVSRSAEPLEIGEAVSQITKPVSPILWMACAALLILSLGLLVLRQTVVGVASGAVGLGLAIVAILRNSSISAEPELLAAGATLGKAPYTSCECLPSAAMVKNLAQVAEQLRDAAMEGNWSLNTDDFNRHATKASAAKQGSNFALAVREYCLAMRSLMSELRKQGGKRKLERADDDPS